MDADLKAKWVTALRSGNYKQTKGVLRSNRNGYCCLGVLCDISGKGEWSQTAISLSTKINGQRKNKRGFIYKVGQEEYDVEFEESLFDMSSLDDIADLVMMNDKGKRFSTIANWIEKNL